MHIYLHVTLDYYKFKCLSTLFFSINDSYPVILSIENHCSVTQQHVLAEHLTNILGDMLHKEQRDEELGKLPSPEDLKGKILIKVCCTFLYYEYSHNQSVI